MKSALHLSGPRRARTPSGIPSYSSSGDVSSVKTAPAPPRTHGAVVRGARQALRNFREDRAAGRAPKLRADQPWRLLLDVPLPVAADIEARGVPLEQAPFTISDEGDWPGGMIQRFRALRQVIDPMLDGYDSSFLGMLESPSDGLGVWQMKDMVVAGIVVNATYGPFERLCQGGFGAQPTRADQAVVAVAEWTRGDDIGQPWQRDLKARARELIDDGGWRPLYSARMLRTSKGRAYGCLTAAWGEPWRLYGSSTEDSGGLEDTVLLESWEEPARNDVTAALNQYAERRREQGGGGGGGGKGWGLW